MKLNASLHLHFDYIISPVRSLSHPSWLYYLASQITISSFLSSLLQPSRQAMDSCTDWSAKVSSQCRCNRSVSVSDVSSKAPGFTSYGLFTLHGTGTGVGSRKETRTIGNNGSWSLSRTSLNISTSNIRTHWSLFCSLFWTQSWARAVWIYH